MIKESAPLNRMTELDGLRFIAVCGVMAVHFSPGTLATWGPWGSWGVCFFYVLSGFLITQILLGARARLDAGRTRAAAEYGRFFLRRALRLWPAYLLAVLGATVLGIDFAADMLPWNLMFAGNYFVVLHQTWPELLSHLWTLAVEQQFYLLWPLFILLAPRAIMPATLYALIAAGPLFRLLELVCYPEGSTKFILLPACVDYFAWGALIAWSKCAGVSRRHCPATIPAGKLAAAFFLLSLAGYGFDLANRLPRVWPALDGTLVAVGSWFLILHCIKGGESTCKSTLRWPAFVYLGEISYGIYLFHNFAHWLGPRLLRKLTHYRMSYFDNEAIHLGYLVTLSLLLAIASRHLVEQPINRLKNRITAG